MCIVRPFGVVPLDDFLNTLLDLRPDQPLPALMSDIKIDLMSSDLMHFDEF